MTPEEAREQIIALMTDLEIQHAIERIVFDAVKAAVMAERERCALVAESFIPSGFTSEGKAGNTYAVARDDRARTIATAIRAR